MKFPTIKDVSLMLRQTHFEAFRECFYSDEIEYIDVRLQVYPNGEWRVNSGDASCDSNHHGFWGASSIPMQRHWSGVAAERLARDLIEQCRDNYAQAQDNVLQRRSKRFLRP